jgi:hypothetical protein
MWNKSILRQILKKPYSEKDVYPSIADVPLIKDDIEWALKNNINGVHIKLQLCVTSLDRYYWHAEYKCHSKETIIALNSINYDSTMEAIEKLKAGNVSWEGIKELEIDQCQT